MHDRLHRRAEVAAFERGRALEERTRDFVQVDREVELVEPIQRRGQPIDRVVADGHGAVAALVRDLQIEVAIELLGGLHGVEQLLAGALAPAAAFVQAELRLDQRAMIVDQPRDAVVVAAFFIRGERDDDVALGLQAFLSIADQVGDEDRGHRLVVGGAAAVVVAVALDELERIEIGRPVFLVRLDDVEMREQQQRLLRAVTTQPRDEIALLRVARRHEDAHVFLRKSCGNESRSHRARRRGVVADGVGRVDLDQLFVDVEQRLLLGLEIGCDRDAAVLKQTEAPQRVRGLFQEPFFS